MLPASSARATGSSTRRRTSRRCATSTRRSLTASADRRSSRRRGDVVEAIDERTLLVPITPRPLQDGRDPGRRGDRRRAHEVGAHVVLDAYQSGGRRAARRDRARRRLRGRRLGQVALRRARRTAGSTCGPDLAERPRADVHRLAGARAAVRLRAGAATTRTGAARFLTGTPNVPALYAATAGYDVIEEVGDRPDPRALRRADDSC